MLLSLGFGLGPGGAAAQYGPFDASAHIKLGSANGGRGGGGTNDNTVGEGAGAREHACQMCRQHDQTGCREGPCSTYGAGYGAPVMGEDPPWVAAADPVGRRASARHDVMLLPADSSTTPSLRHRHNASTRDTTLANTTPVGLRVPCADVSCEHCWCSDALSCPEAFAVCAEVGSPPSPPLPPLSPPLPLSSPPSVPSSPPSPPPPPPPSPPQPEFDGASLQKSVDTRVGQGPYGEAPLYGGHPFTHDWRTNDAYEPTGPEGGAPTQLPSRQEPPETAQTPPKWSTVPPDVASNAEARLPPHTDPALVWDRQTRGPAAA